MKTNCSLELAPDSKCSGDRRILETHCMGCWAYTRFEPFMVEKKSKYVPIPIRSGGHQSPVSSPPEDYAKRKEVSTKV